MKSIVLRIGGWSDVVSIVVAYTQICTKEVKYVLEREGKGSGSGKESSVGHFMKAAACAIAHARRRARRQPAALGFASSARSRLRRSSTNASHSRARSYLYPVSARERYSIRDDNDDAYDDVVTISSTIDRVPMLACSALT
jgi:hypothetical protein